MLNARLLVTTLLAFTPMLLAPHTAVADCVDAHRCFCSEFAGMTSVVQARVLSEERGRVTLEAIATLHGEPLSGELDARLLSSECDLADFAAEPGQQVLAFVREYIPSCDTDEAECVAELLDPPPHHAKTLRWRERWSAGEEDTFGVADLPDILGGESCEERFPPPEPPPCDDTPGHPSSDGGCTLSSDGPSDDTLGWLLLVLTTTCWRRARPRARRG
jgi:hypothetical protein